ncbi:MAG: hypothetical protein A3G95_02005 [Flavobacteria bacterium RIFCSPLOWO2_12_FULL_31_7]|nr:MAG: hypothetical protein A3G95_02005 [Flavobacteria bacterium RIFCSPLOWO2_12_FULL_31_7]
MDFPIAIIIILLLLVVLSNINSKYQKLQDSISHLNSRVQDLSKQINQKEKSPNEALKEIFKEDPVAKKPEIVEEQPKPIFEQEKIIPVVRKFAHQENVEEKNVYETPTAYSEKPIRVPEKSWFEKFKENNPDLEKFIGENLINKIGILILVLGISFFVKYAIDKNWINETARVAIGILSGSLVMGIAHKLKKNYIAFSSVIVAGAISIYYFTIAIAFHDYHIFNQTVAFAIMVVITAFSAFVSINYNRQELAVLSLIGGFAVPFMVSTGQGNYVILFTYIAILNVGILAIAYFKKWNLVTILSFVFSTLLFLSWSFTEMNKDTFSHQGAFIFATLFYFIFSITVVINNVRNKGVFSTIEYFIITANTFIYFGIGLTIIEDAKLDLKGLFTLSLAIYNFIYTTILFKKFGLEKNAVYLLIALVLTFVTLTIPIQFEGNHITLFWACEAVMLFWLSQKSKISLFKLSAVAVQILMIFSLIIDWFQVYGAIELTLNVVLNKIFITGIVALASIIATYFVLNKETENSIIYKFTFHPVLYKNFIILVGVIMAYFVGILEVSYQATEFLSNYHSAYSFSVVYHFVFATALIAYVFSKNKELFFKPVLILMVVNVIAYLVFYSNLPTQEMVQNIEMKSSSNFAFYFHYILLICLVYHFVILIKQIKDTSVFEIFKSKFTIWIIVISGIYILSNELLVHAVHFNDVSEIETKIAKTSKTMTDKYALEYEIEIVISDAVYQVKTQVIKIGYPILLGILSFILLIAGIKHQWKQIRIIALSLLGLTVLKLFIYDINNVSETGKIIAFILLGVLILIISFVYQKIKKLVVDESSNVPSDEN